MHKLKFLKQLLYISLMMPIMLFADNTTTTTTTNNTTIDPYQNNVLVQKANLEQSGINNPFFISFYEPNYILPFYYTGSPDYSIYENNTPDQQNIQSTELNFQLSLKVPIIQHIAHHNSTLYLAYTQLSFWQAYNNSPFFRETNYQPELFLANRVDWQLGKQWLLNFVNVGAEHESNGRGGLYERSWNRVYGEAIFSNGNFVIDVKPWYIVPDSSLSLHNPDIGTYLGHEQTLFIYKCNRQEFSLLTRNTVESGFKHSAYQLAWSFPLTAHLNGYVEYFGGYGQSLIEYNHYTNSVGVGIALSNWV